MFTPKSGRWLKNKQSCSFHALKFCITLSMRVSAITAPKENPSKHFQLEEFKETMIKKPLICFHFNVSCFMLGWKIQLYIQMINKNRNSYIRMIQKIICDKRAMIKLYEYTALWVLKCCCQIKMYYTLTNNIL